MGGTGGGISCKGRSEDTPEIFNLQGLIVVEAKDGRVQVTLPGPIQATSSPLFPHSSTRSPHSTHSFIHLRRADCSLQVCIPQGGGKS